MKPKGFTLIELLVVIAILAVLAVAVVLVLNPAELIKQARDTTRISDLAALNSAVAFYLADYPSASINAGVAAGRCTVGTAPPPGMIQTCTNSTSTEVDGDGWVLVDFTDISSGSPLPRLPMDPINAAATSCEGGAVDVCMYVFANDTANHYEINANMESTKYGGASSGSNVELGTKDGGDDDYWYEVGNDPDLNL
ncbi:MAG: prepilin-type N-terminal cleavage/methylation domain-containing protein [Candidatus Brennerbacteria bacterium]